jgi:hypothetical protein
MKIAINEKQLKLILSKTDMDEEETAPATTSTPTSTDSSSPTSTSTASSYPTVTKWESGVKRGAGNQIGVTKWSDIVGASLQRGKANPLT